jgi:hypothetical protein
VKTPAKSSPEWQRNQNNPSVDEQEEQPRLSYRRNTASADKRGGHSESRSEDTISAKNRNTAGPKNESRNRLHRKCMLIHDSTFEHFDPAKFTSKFDINQYPIKRVSQAARSTKLIEEINREKPECVYIHLGLHDIINGSVNKILDSYEELLDVLLRKTKARLCFSLIIPTDNDTHLNKKIEEVNRELRRIITTVRREEKLEDKLFTYENSSVAWLNKKLPQGTIELTARGKLVMLTKLQDGLRKTLRLPRPDLKGNKKRDSRQNSSRND